MANKIKQQSTEELDRIAKVSMNIRQAIRKMIPAGPEQFFTLMVPGKVINFDDFVDHNAETRITPASSIQLAEARLCDDMPTLSSIQLGPSGRSVSRSYEAALNQLTAVGTTHGIDDKTKPTPAEKRYQKAKEWLAEEVPNFTGMTRVDVYREKSDKYADAIERAAKAYDDALERIKKNPKAKHPTTATTRDEYSQWVNKNHKKLDNMIQAAWMDLVTNGNKDEVESKFAIVDVQSAMAAVEGSKATMRKATVTELDGSVEYQKVQLDPSNWAALAKNKALAPPTGETVASLTWKIARLEKTNVVLEGISRNHEILATGTPKVLTKPSVDTEVDGYFAHVKAYNDAVKDYDAKDAGEEKDAFKATVKERLDAMNQAKEDFKKKLGAFDEFGTDKLTETAVNSRNELLGDQAEGLKGQITANTAQINKYTDQLKKLQKGTTAEEFTDSFATTFGIPSASTPKQTGEDTVQPDYWTSITLEVSSSSSDTDTNSESNSYSVGASFSWGLWGGGGSVSHSDATANAAKQMAESSIKVSFACMRVDIRRPWLNAELFANSQLKATAGSLISPGPVKLARLMDPDNYPTDTSSSSPEQREKELSKYELFPMYPTSFLLAANVILRIDGDTSDIQSHFHTSSTNATPSLGWGPFQITGGFAHKDTRATSTCEATATGCKITIHSPQIIGWISEMVPALPRLVKEPGSEKPEFEEHVPEEHVPEEPEFDDDVVYEN
ncbi:hypothetical protein BDM02DRAFT_3186460 [Thelephora ganbajun]|uniref:Uncharacterized protein n=1 Tax=Thelephora ganbajun TaxID=370292 RepID=A0ACB6ZHL9_THEGA|nr:hypothetical protein BDM02DRAFT_3186460 [Thelephora ganbajun]